MAPAEAHPPAVAPPDTGEARSVVEHVTCCGCGCLCDDIVVTLVEGRIQEARNTCDLGSRWFFQGQDEEQGDRAPAARLAGEAAGLDEALDRAAQVLREARAPVVQGLSSLSLEAQSLAVALADRLGAVLDPAADEPLVQAIQRVGIATATLGEVRNRADVVVFWRADPLRTHPRHWERYSVEPSGRFVPGGRAGRTVLVADTEPTETARHADRYLPVSESRELAILWSLRALVRGTPLDPTRIEQAAGLSFDQLSEWSSLLRQAHYGALFLGTVSGPDTGEAVLRLARDLNEVTRFAVLGLGSAGNAAGARAVCSWQTGVGFAIDFARGAPRFLPGDASAGTRLPRGEADAVVVLGEPARDPPPGVRSIVLSAGGDAPSRSATVGFRTARMGLQSGGTVMRTDGVTLPLRPVLRSPWPTEAELLTALIARLA